MFGAILAVILWLVLPRIAADLTIGSQSWLDLAAFGLVVGGAGGLALNVGSRLFRGKAPAAR